MSIVSGVMGALATGDAAHSAAESQKYASDQATALAQSQYNQTRQDEMPYLLQGYDALTNMANMQRSNDPNNALNYSQRAPTSIGQLWELPGYRSNYTWLQNALTPAQMAEKPANEVLNLSPNYQWRMDEGNKAIERSAAARGMTLSGSTIKGIDNYSQNLAADEYNNFLNRYTSNYGTSYNQMYTPYTDALSRYSTEFGNQYNRYSTMAGLGSSAQNVLAGAGQNYVTNSNSATMAGGNAEASGYTNSANALTSALQSTGNNTLSGLGAYNYLSKLYGNSDSGSTGDISSSGSSYLYGLANNWLTSN